VLLSGPVFSDGDPLQLRYSTHLGTANPWSFIAGTNADLTPHWSAQAEVDLGKATRRLVFSLTFRP